MNRFKTFCIKDRTIKLSCLIVFSIIFLGGICVATETNATTYECLNSTTLVEIVVSDEECPNCPPPPECPPIIACPIGESCQFDPPENEQQQYPPAEAASWVASLGCTNLTDVSIDDPRWGSREEGEVYSQENNECLSFYWPGNGNALFDISSRISNPARWNDYRFSVGGQPRGGQYTVTTGKMNIQFNDNGIGGMTVFQFVDAVEPPPTTGFLTPYINPEREKLPAHKIYPLGQKMMISAWNPGNISTVDMLHANGFTAIGPFENAWPSANKNLNAIFVRAKQLGMRAWLFMHTGEAGLIWKLCEGFKAGKTDEQMMQPMVNLWNNYYSKEPYNSITDAFLMVPEEMSTRLDTCKESDILRFNDKMISKIKELDKATPPRPIIRTEVTGAGGSNLQKTAKRVASPHAQHYFERPSFDGYWANIQRFNAGVVRYTNDLNKNYPISEKRYAGVLPGMIYEPSNKTLAHQRKYANYYIWTSLIQGMRGISLYKLEYNVAKGNLKKAFIETIKRLTSDGFDQAFLWGDAKPDTPLVFKQISGPIDSGVLGAKSLLAAERQFGAQRYIAMTNSHGTQNLNVRISGLPIGGYKLHDIVANTTITITNSTKTVILEPYAVKIYKISK